MKITGMPPNTKGNFSFLTIQTKDGRTFLLEDFEAKIKITVPGERIMYGTEEGNNNAGYLILVK